MLKKRQHEIKFHCVYTNVDVVKNPFMPIWSKVFAISSHTSSSSRGFISHSVRKTSTLNDAVNLIQSQHTHTQLYIYNSFRTNCTLCFYDWWKRRRKFQIKLITMNSMFDWFENDGEQWNWNCIGCMCFTIIFWCLFIKFGMRIVR